MNNFKLNAELIDLCTSTWENIKVDKMEQLICPQELIKITEVSTKLHNETSLMAQQIQNLPAMQQTWVQSLTQEGPLEEEMTAHSSISCLRNPMDRGAWHATVHEVTKSQT